MSLYSRLDRLAADVEKLNRQVTAVANSPQSQRTSVEGGSIDFNDADGNLMAIVGGQDDGSNTIRHVDGPTPPIPSGLSAHVDGPIVQVSWDGTFESDVTHDWHYLEVLAVGPNDEQLTGTINDLSGGETSLAATSQGDWFITARSVSRAGKRSLDGDAGTVAVQLVGLTGAIEAVQESANGKNKVTYSSHAPTSDDPGIFDDTWFVGQVGRPNDVVEATNLATNPSFEGGVSGWTQSNATGLLTSTATFVDRMSGSVGSSNGLLTIASGHSSPYASARIGDTEKIPATPGTWVAVRAWAATEQTGEKLRVQVRVGASGEGYDYFATPFSTAGFYTGRTMLVSFQVPAGKTEFRPEVQLYSGSSSVNLQAGKRMWIDGVNIVSADSEEKARSLAGGYFDGDTPSGTTDNESHYRWTGEPHASTSEKYLPALDIGESDNWNVIEQYRHDGTGWVKVELSHYVFSTVDLGKATVGELDGIRIMGQTVRGEQLSGDAIDGKVITGGTYRTTGGTGSWSDAGLFIAQPDGTSMVRFPTDGTPLSLTASDTQIERASIGELDLSYGAVRSGGEFTLASGVTAPASPPELTTGWQKLCTFPKPSQPSDTNTLGYWANGNQWVRAIDVAEIGVIDRIETYDYETGQVVNSFEIGLNPRHGLTVIGDVAYVMGKDYTRPNPEVYVFGYDLNTGARVTRWEYTRGIQARNALGNDGTNLIIGSVYNLELWVHRRNPVTGVQVGSDMRSGSNSWPASGGKDLFGVRISGNDVEVVTSWGGRVYLNSNNALVRKTDSANASGYAGWVLPAHDVSGCAWVSGAPYPVDSSGSVYKGTVYSSDLTVQTCFTWTDGTHESTPSPAASGTTPARSALTVSLPIRSGLQKRVYLNAGSGWVWGDVSESATTWTFPSSIGGFSDPPTTNSFPNADPAILKSTNDTFVVKGDGSGHWGPLTFNADGTMTSSQIPEWVPVTTFLNDASAQTFGHTPAYRVWPDGKVEWRGVVAFPRSSNIHFLTVPSVARPAYDVHWACVTDSVSPGVSRVDICDPQAPTAMKLAASSARVWVSLDGIYYYKN